MFILAVALFILVGIPSTAAQSIEEIEALKREVEALYFKGRFAEATALAEKRLRLAEESTKPSAIHVVESRIHLATLYKLQGRIREAKAALERSLADGKMMLGSDHPLVGTSAINLARVYDEQGRNAEAEALFLRGLQIQESVLGKKDPEIARILNDLALVYEAQERFDAAEPLLIRSLSIRENQSKPDARAIRIGLNNLASNYREQGRFREAEALMERLLVHAQRAAGLNDPALAIELNNFAEIYRATGRMTAAEEMLKRSLEIRERAFSPEHPQVAAALVSLAAVYLQEGRYDEAEGLFMRARSIVEKVFGANNPDAAILNNLALVYKNTGRLLDAKRLLEESLVVTESKLGKESQAAARALSNLADIHIKLGEFAQAEQLLRRSLQYIKVKLGPTHIDVGSVLANLAGLFHQMGRNAEAVSYYMKSIEIGEKALGGDHPDVGSRFSGLAKVALSERNWSKASSNFRRSIVISRPRVELRAENTRDRFDGGNEKLELAARSGALIRVLHRQVSAGRVPDNLEAFSETFQLAQIAGSSSLTASVSQMAARSGSGSALLSAIIRERQDLASEWQAKDRRLVSLISKLSSQRDSRVEAELKERLAKIDKRIDVIDLSIEQNFPDYASLATPRPASIAVVQEALRHDEALVLILDTAELVSLPEETFVWVVTKNDVRWLRSELGTAALRREVSALRCGLDRTAWQDDGTKNCAKLLSVPSTFTLGERQPLPFDAARAHALYKSLLGDAQDLIEGKHLLVVPSGALTKLPFQVLVTEAPMPDTPLEDIAWLARKHAITVLPSVSSLKALRRVAKPSRADRPMIGFGNPLLDGPDSRYTELARRARAIEKCRETVFERVATFVGLRGGFTPVATRGGLADLDHLKRQKPLPETADELCAVARDLGADVRSMHLGAKATESEVKRLSESGDLARYRILHFATHGTLAGQLSGTTEPGLILTPPKNATEQDDGYLSGSEIASLKLDADWVILSACNTAGGSDDTNAEALSGLARVFFYAGARALLVSHWEVYSEATVKLITKAARSIADGSVGRAEALRRAMLDMIDNGKPHEAHPAYWAPFVVVGEGAG